MTQVGKRIDAIDFLKVLLTIGIVFRHSELVGLEGRSAAFDVLSRGMMLLTEICVPLFFVLSGYLFFRNTPDRADVKFFADKWKKRVFSLLIPYLIANCVAFACYWAAYRFVPEMMSGFFGDDWKNPLFVFWTGPVNMSLWFIRDLIIACITAPLIWLLVRYTRIWGVIALAAVWIWLGGSPWYNLWFTIGAWAAVCQGDATGRLLGNIRCRVPADAAAWCFFMYLYHYIPVISFKKLFIAKLEPGTLWPLVGTYLAVALLTLCLVTAVYYVMKKLLPKVTGVLVGGKL